MGTSDDPISDDYEDPEDTSPRPKIRVLGAPRVGGRGNWRSDQQVVEGLSDDGSGPPALGRGTVLDPEAKRAYDAALSLVNARQYGSALAALAAFLVKWPDHPYVDHAMYWRGECYFARADYTAASEQFEGVVARFPGGSKAPDALLKLGMCHQKLGHASQAKASFDRLLQEYPQSDAARRAPNLASSEGPGSVIESGATRRTRGPAPEELR
jgi:tol-pal system protein YbgF